MAAEREFERLLTDLRAASTSAVIAYAGDDDRVEWRRLAPQSLLDPELSDRLDEGGRAMFFAADASPLTPERLPDPVFPADGAEATRQLVAMNAAVGIWAYQDAVEWWVGERVVR